MIWPVCYHQLHSSTTLHVLFAGEFIQLLKGFCTLLDGKLDFWKIRDFSPECHRGIAVAHYQRVDQAAVHAVQLEEHEEHKVYRPTLRAVQKEDLRAEVQPLLKNYWKLLEISKN